MAAKTLPHSSQPWPSLAWRAYIHYTRLTDGASSLQSRPLSVVKAENDLELALDGLLEENIFPRLLVQWLLACFLAGQCQTLKGKAYETRSGAEANLKIGLAPATYVSLQFNILASTSSDLVYLSISISTKEASQAL
ncbi:unnamed protein product [Protopolystoma xenopodis]|uniref:Uncharacterized protein n=1 Tax=Protopolystoma xenopodis TaxID=117903 RepID=A0A3S5AWY2_9PLAT|nr:unnamed protein product [Protopolystoma xenopodis]